MYCALLHKEKEYLWFAYNSYYITQVGKPAIVTFENVRGNGGVRKGGMGYERFPLYFFSFGALFTPVGVVNTEVYYI